MISTNLNRLLATLGVAAGALFSAAAGDAEVIYRSELNGADNWGVNATPDTSATFGFNYSTVGIPEAPNSAPGDAATSGLKTEANISRGASSFLTLYPVGESFSGDYQLRFDAWINFEDNVGTSTEFIGGGLGYDGVTADVASGAQLIATGDGGSASDWRALKSGFFVDSSAMAAGTRQGSDPYYADFLPEAPAPAAQGQAGGVSTPGSPGFQWVTYEFTAIGGVVDVVIEKPNGDRLPIVTMDCNDTSDGSNGCTIDGNISLFYADFFTSIGNPTFQYGVFDNVVVTQIPEPTTSALLLLGAAAATRRRR
ncbi:PEP-CTERM sorting domain-containing protein [Botrimarina sp.]|uniref:PEP-CTERM sorting domain-containing protein n=1 Tax=Botrimarina sp. TaxID=2795802 RepID=UPI0032ED9D62